MNPFATPGNWLRCALHAHTTASDGEAPPSALAAHYARAGYDVLATTDHWNVTAIESDEILVIPSSELNASLPNGRDGHVLAFGIDRVPERREPFPSLAAAAEWIDSAGGVAYLAHPRWTGAGVTEMLDAPGVCGIEVFNAGCELECSRGLAGDYWDNVLSHGRRCFGLATDDSHMPGFDSGHAWTLVRTEERSAPAVIDALREGRFYASHGRDHRRRGQQLSHGNHVTVRLRRAHRRPTRREPRERRSPRPALPRRNPRTDDRGRDHPRAARATEDRRLGAHRGHRRLGPPRLDESNPTVSAGYNWPKALRSRNADNLSAVAARERRARRRVREADPQCPPGT